MAARLGAPLATVAGQRCSSGLAFVGPARYALFRGGQFFIFLLGRSLPCCAAWGIADRTARSLADVAALLAGRFTAIAAALALARGLGCAGMRPRLRPKAPRPWWRLHQAVLGRILLIAALLGGVGGYDRAVVITPMNERHCGNSNGVRVAWRSGWSAHRHCPARALQVKPQGRLFAGSHGAGTHRDALLAPGCSPSSFNVFFPSADDFCLSQSRLGLGGACVCRTSFFTLATRSSALPSPRWLKFINSGTASCRLWRSRPKPGAPQTPPHNSLARCQ